MTTSIARDASIATEIGKFHLVAELARGGMGNVYLAVAQGPGGFSKLLVLKELKPELSDDETYVSMFLDEARLAARLIHPNIVQTNEVGSDGRRHFMVMEYLDGRSLHRIVKRLGERFPICGHLRVLSEMLLGLQYAHELREFDGAILDIVHRDVSPLNVFVTFAGQAKVLDFGIAKAVDSSLETKMGVLKGRVAYMSPEQAKGSKVDRRGDVYSAGVMLWEAAAGRRLWPGMSEVEILTHLLREGPPALRSVRPDAPLDLERICTRAMAWNRDERYSSAGEMLHDLETHLASRGDTMSMREVGALVAQAFADERRKMNTVIEETLTRVRGGPRSGVMPTFQTQIVGTPTSAGIDAVNSAMRFYTPSTSFPPSSGPSSLGSLSRSAPATTATLNSVQSPEQLGSGGSKRTALVTAAFGALLLGAGLFGASLRGGKSASEAAPAHAVTAPAPTGSATARDEGDLVDLVVRVSPASAQISIDGASVVSNPFHARYPKDNQIHHVSLSADGYETKLEDVNFSNDVSIDVSLNRRPTAPAHPATAVTPPAAVFHANRHVASAPPAPVPEPTPPPVPAPPATRLDVAPQGGHAPLRPIATSNPYGTP